MVLSIANRVSIAIGLLLLLFFVSIAISFYLTKRFDDDLAQVTGIDAPRQETVHEMEVRLAEAARNILAYAADGQALSREQMRQAEAEFERAGATFRSLAVTAQEGNLGGQVLVLFEEMKGLGSEVVAASNLEAEVLARGRDGIEALRQSLRDKADAMIAELGEEPPEQLTALLGMDATVDRVAAAMEATASSRDAGARDDAQAAEAAFYRHAARFSEISPASGDQQWMEQAAEGFQALLRDRDSLVAAVERKRQTLAKFEAQRAQVQELLANRLTPLLRKSAAQVEPALDFSTYTIIMYLLLMSVFFVGSGAAMLLTRGIVRPINELTAGAEAIGRGMLEHRISVESQDEIGNLAESFNRMAENRQQAENALRELAHHDVLTKLPNRALFQSRLAEALDSANRVDRMAAVYFLDLDHFKDINDTLGHPAGDLLLKQVADRISGCLRRADTVARLESETVARLGGDEFAIIQTNIRHASGVGALAKRLIDALSKPYDLDGEQVFTGCSIGITVYPHDGTEPDQLLKNADLALYRAKQEGRNTYRLFDKEMNAEIQARKALEQDIRQAIDDEEFFIDYQPQHDVTSGWVVGAEALLRWRHKDRGAISPAEFIPVAEQTGLIIPLTELVLRDVCAQTKKWREAGLPPLRVSVNLSAADFRRKDLVPMVTRVIEESGTDPRWLELEITESMVMVGAESMSATLHELKAIGVELAIDDFGTGFSSMSYLKQFPLDRLKIDQAFVRDILTNAEDASITKAIIKLGQSLGLKVIAEGVETEEQLKFLRLRGCDEAQGYYFSPALSSHEFVKFAQRRLPDSAVAASPMA